MNKKENEYKYSYQEEKGNISNTNSLVYEDKVRMVKSYAGSKLIFWYAIAFTIYTIISFISAFVPFEFSSFIGQSFMILINIGIWSTYFRAQKDPGMDVSGMRMVRAVVIIEFCFLALSFFLLIIAVFGLVGLSTSLSNQSYELSILFLLLFICIIGIGVLFVLFLLLFNVLKNIIVALKVGIINTSKIKVVVVLLVLFAIFNSATILFLNFPPSFTGLVKQAFDEVRMNQNTPIQNISSCLDVFITLFSAAILYIYNSKFSSLSVHNFSRF